MLYCKSAGVYLNGRSWRTWIQTEQHPYTLHQTLTQRGAKLDNISLEKIVQLYAINAHSIWVKTNISQYTRFYIDAIGAKILFGQRLWDIDSWFFYRGVETRSLKSCIFEGVEGSRKRKHLKIGGSENAQGMFCWIIAFI